MNDARAGWSVGGATQRYQRMHRTDEDALTEAIIQLASEYGRYGYRRITALLQEAGWPVGKAGR